MTEQKLEEFIKDWDVDVKDQSAKHRETGLLFEYYNSGEEGRKPYSISNMPEFFASIGAAGGTDEEAYQKLRILGNQFEEITKEVILPAHQSLMQGIYRQRGGNER